MRFIIMYELLVKKTAIFLAQKSNIEINSEKYDVLWYGIYGFYINFFKTVLLLLLSLILNVTFYVVVYTIAFTPLRHYSFGHHFKKQITCTITGLASILGSVYFSLYIGVPFVFKGILIVFALGVFYLKSPVETKKRPIRESSKPMLKRNSLIFLCVLSVAVFTIPSPYSDIICLAIFFQTLNLIPTQK